MVTHRKRGGHRRFCGRDFSPGDLETIRRLIVGNPSANRARLSRMVCSELEWVRPDGRLKDMSCRVAMIRMHEAELIQLPPPTQVNGNGKRYRRRTKAAEPREPFTVKAGEIPDLHLSLTTGKDSHLWNEFIDRYHYLGYTPLPGAQLRYFVRSGPQPLAVVGFGAAAWKTAPRDQHIGWSAEQRERSLHLVVNNARFLILPWIKSRNLASMLLGKLARQLPGDWEERYGYRPVLLETFVGEQYPGTCYRAANWVRLGMTKGRGKLDRYEEANLPKKSVWIYPLDSDYRAILTTPPGG